MPIIAQVIIRDLTPAEYDKVRDACGWLEDAPTGGHAHLTWFDGPDCHNLDAWQDEAALEAFATERLGPAMASVGVDRVPEITVKPAHEVYLPEAVTVT